ncbi:BEL1-like homeodomain protein 7 [Typha angustifolia]|uniref:BEL1-like homeodomain protein 7 n=1 Tax=Typha angustifolia TaxID=59011 RepID=UPI003C2C3AFB
MATYYSSSGNQRDMPTLYSSEPENSSYPVPSVMGNLVYPNHSSSGPYSEFVGVTTMISQDSSTAEPDLIASHLGHHPYNAMKDGRNEMLFMQMIGGSPSSAADLVQSSVAEDHHNSGRLKFGILNGQNLNFQQPNMPNVQGQGLSLSLGTQILMPSFQYLPAKPEISTTNSHQLNLLGNGESHRDDDSRMKQMQSDVSRTIPSSKYLKAAQALLDEVVNVRKALKQKAQKCQSWNKSAGMTDCKDSDGGSKGDGAPLNPDESNANSSNELPPSERQELQNKMTKLLVMLDEVDRKYKHYYNQMQIVVSSFDVVAGSGAAKPYTAVALQTISRHFRCLRDAISDQIQSIRKVLGEEDSSTGKAGGFTRLRYIDQQLRQQRVVQQFGMIQQNGWRPQRGLPENSVSVLRAWLFEHFLHPYPKDSEKLMLARQTGLTRSQISNWFINARVRLWKPMIEDMYKEEIGDMEMESNSSSDNVPRSKDEIGSSEEKEDLKSSERCQTSQFNDSKANNTHMNLGGAEIGFHNEANADDTFMNLMLKDQRPGGRDSGLLHDAVTQISDGNGRFMSYQMAKIGNYGNGSVSLTLGLHHSDGGLTVPNCQQGFPDVRGEEIYSTAPLGINGSDYDSMGLMDQRQIETPPLLHDFVG